MTATEIVQKEGFCNSCRLPLGEEFGKHKMMDSFNTLLHLFPESAMGIYEGKTPECGFYCTKCALLHEVTNSKIYNRYASIMMQKDMMVMVRRHLETQEVLGVEFVEVDKN